MDRGEKREKSGHPGRGNSSEKGKWEAGITDSTQLKFKFSSS